MSIPFLYAVIEFVGTVKGLLAQWIEQQISNLWVPGSNPGEIAKFIRSMCMYCLGSGQNTENIESSNSDWIGYNCNEFSSKNVVVLISGNGSNLQALIDYGFDIKKVFSNNPNAKGLQRAKDADIPTEAVSSLMPLRVKLRSSVLTMMSN